MGVTRWTLYVGGGERIQELSNWTFVHHALPSKLEQANSRITEVETFLKPLVSWTSLIFCLKNLFVDYAISWNSVKNCSTGFRMDQSLGVKLSSTVQEIYVSQLSRYSALVGCSTGKEARESQNGEKKKSNRQKSWKHIRMCVMLKPL